MPHVSEPIPSDREDGGELVQGTVGDRVIGPACAVVVPEHTHLETWGLVACPERATVSSAHGQDLARAGSVGDDLHARLEKPRRRRRGVGIGEEPPEPLASPDAPSGPDDHAQKFVDACDVVARSVAVSEERRQRKERRDEEAVLIDDEVIHRRAPVREQRPAPLRFPPVRPVLAPGVDLVLEIGEAEHVIRPVRVSRPGRGLAEVRGVGRGVGDAEAGGDPQPVPAVRRRCAEHVERLGSPRKDAEALVGVAHLLGDGIEDDEAEPGRDQERVARYLDSVDRPRVELVGARDVHEGFDRPRLGVEAVHDAVGIPDPDDAAADVVSDRPHVDGRQALDGRVTLDLARGWRVAVDAAIGPGPDGIVGGREGLDLTQRREGLPRRGLPESRRGEDEKREDNDQRAHRQGSRVRGLCGGRGRRDNGLGRNNRPVRRGAGGC